MKRSNNVSSSRRKQRLRHFSAPSSLRRKLMSCRLSKELRVKYGVRSLPIRKNDEVRIKGEKKTAKVVQVYRKKWCVHLDKVTRDKQNGQTVFLPVKPSRCTIEKLHLNTDRKKLLERRGKDKQKQKNKYAQRDVDMGGVN